MAGAGERERSGELAGDAVGVGRTITDPDLQAEALVIMIWGARAGEYERAERIARTITDPDWQALALSAPAEIVGLWARRLFGQAFALGPWPKPLSVLAKLLPQEAIQIVDAVCADETARHSR